MPTFLLVPLLLAVDSLHFVLARLMLPHIDPALSPTYVLAIATIEVALYAVVTRRLDLSILRENIGLFLVIGFLVAASMTINYTVVEFIDPGTASMLTETGVIWGLLLGVLWLREKLNVYQVIGSLLAIVGVFTISFQSGDYLQIGSLLVVFSALMYALHAALAKRFGDQVDLLNFFFSRTICMAFFTFIFSTVRGSLAWPPIDAWPFLLLSGTVDVAISRSLYYVIMRRMKLSVLTIVLTLSPLVAVIWAFLLFGLLPTSREMIGGLLVLVGAGLVSYTRSAATPVKVTIVD